MIFTKSTLLIFLLFAFGSPKRYHFDTRLTYEYTYVPNNISSVSIFYVNSNYNSYYLNMNPSRDKFSFRFYDMDSIFCELDNYADFEGFESLNIPKSKTRPYRMNKKLWETITIEKLNDTLVNGSTYAMYVYSFRNLSKKKKEIYRKEVILVDTTVHIKPNLCHLYDYHKLRTDNVIPKGLVVELHVFSVNNEHLHSFTLKDQKSTNVSIRFDRE